MTLPVDQVRAVALLLKVVEAQDNLLRIYRTIFEVPEAMAVDGTGCTPQDMRAASLALAKARKAAGL